MFNKAKNAPPEDKAAALVASETSASSPALQNKPTNSSRPSVSVIGSHTQVEGDINSDEDLTIDGRVSGIITCKQHTVTLGANGFIKGDVFAHTLHVSGEVTGNLVVLHRATVHKGAKVSGTIVAPCLVLEDGSIFHGSIDMDPDNDVLKRAFSDTKSNVTKSSASSSTATVTSRKAAAGSTNTSIDTNTNTMDKDKDQTEA